MDELDAIVGDGEREDVQHDQPDACERRDRKERHRDGSDANRIDCGRVWTGLVPIGTT